MSTKLHDLAAHTLLGQSIEPAGYGSSQTGAAVDLLAADGRGFAVLCVGSVAGGTTIATRLEHSADGTSWSAITGATFPNVTAGPVAHLIGFERSQRYVRAVADLTGGSPAANLCAAVGQQKKTI